ncbi:leucyl/phenylalanyl-tRNA--protein transferase [Limnohabitans sp. T6-5]|uniref:leucyl/phenylalanyl-tRNA--protein transferase n=1 Tax=Limnohabitans sp. T6-5 TaxID=1100724 RepID=UPI000D3D6A04|nr:leucyl/phenylalanyl-tRNA--protein transferase [Limnohabitans sp. T6-5]PUE06981.1 leucyl/phenylalanyl-tRNA--protein transferase [Limnohabitans sp. T6-5]
MEKAQHAPELPWIEPGKPLPCATSAWNALSPAPGLLAASKHLTATRLHEAYSQGIFPWFSMGQPVLWWSPDPRMVLHASRFRFHRSLRQTLKRWLLHPDFELSFDRAFGQVIRRCSQAPRAGQKGTWIVPAMISAYEEFHRQGHAHSVEVWLDGELVAGLYFVALGHAVFGESMFTTLTDGSKMALATLVSVCLKHGLPTIDCQQNTPHLASMGAQEMPRSDFVQLIQNEQIKPNISWADQTLNWHALTAFNQTP